jgi:hypothetical protein
MDEARGVDAVEAVVGSSAVAGEVLGPAGPSSGAPHPASVAASQAATARRTIRFDVNRTSRTESTAVIENHDRAAIPDPPHATRGLVVRYVPGHASDRPTKLHVVRRSATYRDRVLG